ncbi:MAG: spore coat U domain-containing protein [Sinobacteraceae bacterium]|nr:spore coat U domain-containing protein [Nevskiaceae bacterium]
MMDVFKAGKFGLLGAVFAMTMGLGPASVSAATATSTLTVTATVLSSCLVAPATLAFGNYDPSATADTTANTSIIVTCTGAASGSVGLDQGANGTSVTARQMAFGAETLNYGLFQDSTLSTNWGNTPGTNTMAFSTAALGNDALTVYGSIPAGQSPNAGAYTDTVNITVTY